MKKFVTFIGYADNVETAPGVFSEIITEKQHSAELVRNIRRLSSGDVNEDLSLTNQLSVLSNPFSQLNFHKIRYATYMGSKWKVTSVEVNYPRLTLNLGGIYNVDTN